MVWDEYITRSFGLIPQNSFENGYYGSWNRLLNTLFPPTSRFTVQPQYLRPNSRDAVDFIVAFLVELGELPVLLIEIKMPSVLDLPSSREEADTQMRRRFDFVRDICPIATLRGISAMGTQMAFYSLDLRVPNAAILPPSIPRDPNVLNDTAPRGRWSLDVLSEEGEAEMRRLVEDITTECAALGDLEPAN